MALDRVFCTPTVTVDQDKYDELVRIKTLYKERIDKNMKVMISQPMNGKTQEQGIQVFIKNEATQEQIEEERADLVKSLEDKGYEVVNTIFAEETPEGDAALFYLAKSIDAMSKVDAVIFMKGWENARGCKIEHEIAVRYNKFIKEL